MPGPDMKEEVRKEVDADMSKNKKDTLSETVNKCLFKTIREMVDGTQPFFLSDEDANQRLNDLDAGIKQLFETIDAKKKTPSP